MTAAPEKRPRVAVLVPYWSFWEMASEITPAKMLEVAERSLQVGISGSEVVALETCDSFDSGTNAGQRLAVADPDVVLIIQAMAVAPGYTWAALAQIPSVPVIVWALSTRSGRLASSFSPSDVTTDGCTVGLSQLSNVLHRRGVPFAAVIGSATDPEVCREISSAILAGYCASAVRRARVGVVGSAPEGYDCVTCDLGQLSQALGLQVVEVPTAEVARQFAKRAGEFETFRCGLAEQYDVPSGDDASVYRSLVAAMALEGIDRDNGLAAGVMNCHAEGVRLGVEVGVAPCFALGRETSRGIPWTCAGDVLTAVAMLIAKTLTGAALYHELNAVDFVTNEIAITNTGEHDLAWFQGPGVPGLVVDQWFERDPVPGLCANFSLPHSPATLIAFTEHPDESSGFRLIAAEGKVTGRTFAQAGTVNGAFAFDVGKAVEAFRAWSATGANHHSALARGRVAEQVHLVSQYLRIGFSRVGGSGA